MDLVETTLNVIENRNTARENLAQCQEELEKGEDYINHLKENLQETQENHSRCKEILEVNNFTKTFFNENCRVVKELAGKVFDYTEQVEERLSSIINQESSLKELYNRNEEHYKALNIKYDNNIKLSDIVENDTQEKLTKEKSDLLNRLNEISTEFVELDGLWKTITNDREEEHKTLESVTLNTEILNDQIEAVQKEKNERFDSIQTKKEQSQKEVEEIIGEVETIDDEIMEVNKSIDEISTKLKDQMEISEEISQNQNEAKMVLDQLKKECLNAEISITEGEKTFEELTTETKSKTEMMKESEEELISCKNKAIEINKKCDEIRLKIEPLNEEIINMKKEYENSVAMEAEILRTIAEIVEENQILGSDSDKLLDSISDYKNNINTKQSDLEQIRSAPQIELSEIKEKMEILDSEFSKKKLELENEIRKLDAENKDLQQQMEELQANLRDLKTKQINLEKEKDQNQKNIKLLIIQNEFTSNEIKRVEAEKQAKVKFTPKPPLKRAPRTIKKRSIIDCDSDSSIDSERLTYQEFVARKKKMDENKKLKR